MELYWGIFARGLGVVYFVAFASLYHQILALAGAQGITPVAEVLKRARVDYPSTRRVLCFPTLLWLNSSDRALKLLLIGGCLASLLVIAGGPLSPAGFFLCALFYLSLNFALDLVTPWDCLLHEAGFLALFLPSLEWLPSLSATAPAPLLLAWAYRWLLFRLMFGFGKQKFGGSTQADRDYMRGFYISQPMPTYLAWYAQRLPMGAHYLSLGIMAVVELAVPFLMFFPGKPSLIAAIATAGLMIVIQAAGSFGIFNILTILLCVTLLDPRSLQLDLSNLPVALVAAVVLVGGLLYLPFNNWVTRTWLDWPSIVAVRAFGIRQLLAFYRFLSPFRIVHAYGVFPPNSTPPARWLPILEGTRDGKTWQEYEYRFMTSTPSSPPCFAAPYQPRFDYSMIYEAYGSNYAGFFSSLLGVGNPYRFTRYSATQCVMQRLLEGSEPVKRLFKNNPFPDAPPVEVRASLMLFTPAKNGQWWVRRHAGPHLAPARLQPRFWEHWLPHPETFHIDDIVWKRRAWAPLDLIPEIEAFWEEFIPAVRAFDHKDWEGLPSFIAHLRDRYGEEKFVQFERTFGRLSTELSEKAEATPSLSHFHRVLVGYWIIGEGRETYGKAINDPSYLPALSARVSAEDGLFYLALFWHDMLEYHARKIRMLEKLAQRPSPSPPKGLPGFVNLVPFLAGHFKIPGEERVPKFTRVASGEWHVSD